MKLFFNHAFYFYINLEKYHPNRRILMSQELSSFLLKGFLAAFIYMDLGKLFSSDLCDLVWPLLDKIFFGTPTELIFPEALRRLVC